MDSATLSQVVSGLAPAAWWALLVLLLLAALARWYDRVPRRVAAVLVLAVALFYGEVLIGGAVLLPLDNLRGHPPFSGLAPTEPHGNLLQGDLLLLVHPARREARRSAAAGAWPLVAPRIGAGMPLLANPQAQVLQPVTVLGEGPLPAIRAPAAVAALRTFLALVFPFLLLRRLGAGKGPALAGALAYGLGGFVQLWVGWPLANTGALLPAVLYALVLVDERGERRDRVLLALSLAALLLAGQPASVVYALAVVAVFALCRLGGRRKRAVGAAAGGMAAGGRTGAAAAAVIPAWAAVLPAWAAAAALAVLLASPALLPFAELLPHTLRWQRLTAASGDAGTAPAGPAGGAPAEALERAGQSRHDAAPATRLVQAAAPHALGNSRFVHYWGRRNSNEDAAGFVGTATLLAALLSLPGWLAGRRPLRHELLGLGLAAAAAVALALPAGVPGRVALVLDLGLVLAAVGTLERFRRGPASGALPRWLRWLGPPAAVLLLAALHLGAYATLSHPQAPETLDVLRRGWVHWHLRFALLAAALLVVGAGRRWTAPALALLVAAELGLAHRPANPPMPERLAFPETPPMTALEEVTGGSPLRRLAAAGRSLPPNLAAVYGLADVRVFDPVAPAGYLELLEPARAGWLGEMPLLDAADHPLLYDRLAVAAILLPPTPEDAPGAARSCPATMETVLVDPAGTVCRRRGALAAVRAGGAEAAQVRASAGGDRWSARFASPVAGRLDAALAAVPGWRVVAEGEAVATGADPLVSARLPTGTRRVEIVYRPTGFVAGMALAGLGWALLLAWSASPPAGGDRLLR